jgi:hypothetical protein
MKVYDNYEISPCWRYEEPDSPGKFYFEVCKPEEADVWTLYGHISGEGVQAIGDFASRKAAEQVYTRITGLPFTGSYQSDDRLRVMHAGPKLLEALITCANLLADYDESDGEEGNAWREAVAVIVEAAGSSPPEPPKPIVVEALGGLVLDVLNIPPGYEYEIKDYDNLEADEEAASGRPV